MYVYSGSLKHNIHSKMYIIPVNIEFQKALNFIAVAIWLAIKTADESSTGATVGNGRNVLVQFIGKYLEFMVN